jgi:hypothetical protein
MIIGEFFNKFFQNSKSGIQATGPWFRFIVTEDGCVVTITTDRADIEVI